MPPDWFAVVIGDWTRANLTASLSLKDSCEVKISNGVTFMGRRLFPDDMRRLAKWLNESADRLDQDSQDRLTPSAAAAAD